MSGAAALLAGLIIAGIAAIAALGSWRSSATAGRAADSLTRIENHRLRAELTPQFEISASSQLTSAGHADMHIILRGPDGLGHLDEVVVRILDERWHDHGGRPTPGGPSAEDIAKHVWGPWEFNTGASEQVADNRTSRSRAYSRETSQDWDRFSLVVTAPPYWATGRTQQQWLRQHAGQPLRLLLSCRLGDYRWELPYDVHVDPRQTGTGT
jgi:hypothetical protein